VTPREAAVAAQLACVLEATAPKPGNVSPGREFADLRHDDFLAAAAAIGEPLSGPAPLGTTIRLAVEATRRRARTNVNLGIVLLLAPLTRAASRSGPPEGGPHIEGVEADLQVRLRGVLNETTVEDAREVYAAIRLASPGGLGKTESQDVASEPDLTLLEVMRLAADRDGIAREYATGFATTFGTGAPAIERARQDGLDWDDAVVEVFLTLLAAAPDTHVARRGGAELAADVSRRARAALDAGGVRSPEGRAAINEMDRALRDPRHTANPGTTADLTAAAIFVALVRLQADPLEELMAPRGVFRVEVRKDYLVFASAHFITFAGHRCEGLHGHNYRASVRVEGALNEESWFVFDFVELKRIMRRLCDEIDHLVLLPLTSDRVQVVEDGETVRVAVDGKPRYVFPRKDCALLPIPNTTVEMLAQMLTERLQAALDQQGAKGLTALEMEVEENFGQSAVYRLTL
jgi:triphosphoribosyl-dephospho-CoA synthase